MTTAAAWNAKGGTLRTRAANGVRALIRGHKPDVIALSECRGIALATIRARTVLKHRTIRPWRYAWQDAALVVARRCKVTAHGVEIVRAPWTGPDGYHWPGKGIPWAVVDGTLYIAVHMPWNPDLNDTAATETLNALARLVVRHGKSRAVLLGDWNYSRGELERIARRLGGRLIEGSGVDNAIVRGLDGEGTPGENFGSDHPSVTYRLEAS
jgi:hypothetical protein